MPFVSDATATTLPSRRSRGASHDDGSTARTPLARLCDHTSARAALAEYAKNGRDAFADARFANAYDHDPLSAQPRRRGPALLAGDWKPSAALSLRKARRAPPHSASARSARRCARPPPTTRRRSSRCQMGTRAPRAGGVVVVGVVRAAGAALAAREVGRPARRRAPAYGGDAREVACWRWQGQHLVRYLLWEAGAAYDGAAPALLLVHGFAASAEQWERLVTACRKTGPKRRTPAADLRSTSSASATRRSPTSTRSTSGRRRSSTLSPR